MSASFPNQQEFPFHLVDVPHFAPTEEGQAGKIRLDYRLQSHIRRLRRKVKKIS
jgi:hypothetical protein